MNATEIKITSKAVTQWLLLIIPVTFAIDLSHYFLRDRFKLFGQFLESATWVNYFFSLSTITILPALFVLLTGALRMRWIFINPSLIAGLFASWYLSSFGFNQAWIDNLMTIFMPLALMVAGGSIYRIWWVHRNATTESDWSGLYWRVFWLCALLALGVSSFLEITPVIFPGTHDYQMHHIDAAFFNPAEKLTAWILGWPNYLRQLLTLIYDLIGWIYIPLIALVLRDGKGQDLNIWRTYIYALGLAIFCYSFIPVSGPLYAFGAALFPEHMDRATVVPTVVSTIQPALRNGMPSMHFTSAVTIAFICAALSKKRYFILSLLFIGGTILSTMGFGEHYLIDLVVALTYSVTVSVLLIGPKRYLAQGAVAKAALLFASVTFLLWMLLFKFAAPWLIENLALVRGLALWSLVLFCVVTYWHVKSVWSLVPAARLDQAPLNVPRLLPKDLQENYWIIGVFFASGMAGLIYEVVFAKALAVTFGASSLAINTVLATYMGGMALGAWLGAKLAQRSANPLKLYALCEAFIGLYALLTPTFFQLIQRVYVALALDQPADAPELTALRLLLGALVLGPVTLFMGATFPIMFARLRQLGVASERAIAPLYAANVIGAAFGALFAGYALIPAVGKTSATYVAALISLLIALYALEKMKMQPASQAQSTQRTTSKTAVAVVAFPVGVAALVILAVGGAVTMGLEVLFMHMLAVVVGNSVYAFGLMLATFLLGLGIGSAVGERAMIFLRRENVVVIAQCGLAITIVVSSLQWDALAGYFSNFGAYEAMGVHITFSGREFIRALICAIAMMPAAFFIGMNYPACMGLATDWLGRHGDEVSGLGKASGINTLGNISGVLLTGFWLLPTLGSRDALLALTVVSWATAGLMVIASSTKSSLVAPSSWPKRLANSLLPLAVVGFFVGLFPKHWDLDKLSEGSNVYFYAQEWGKVIDHAESAEGGLTTVTRSADGLLTLLTNGKFQGNNSESGEMVAQRSFALIPMLHNSRRDNALIIGYGTGMTPRVVHENGFASIDIAELSKDMVNLADRHFENINHAVTSKPNVSTYYTDGRNFLLTQTKKYDLISIEISSIWFAGAANLYNKEFYDLVAKRLQEDGVLQQWIQLHHMQPVDFLFALNSLRSSFKYVWFYVSGGQGIVVASNSEDAAPRELQKQVLKNTMRDSDLTIKDLEGRLLADPKQIDAMLSSFDPTMQALLSTDNNLYLEYSTPKGNALRYDTVPMILKLLMKKYP